MTSPKPRGRNIWYHLLSTGASGASAAARSSVLLAEPGCSACDAEKSAADALGIETVARRRLIAGAIRGLGDDQLVLGVRRQRLAEVRTAARSTRTVGAAALEVRHGGRVELLTWIRPTPRHAFVRPRNVVVGGGRTHCRRPRGLGGARKAVQRYRGRLLDIVVRVKDPRPHCVLLCRGPRCGRGFVEVRV